MTFCLFYRRIVSYSGNRANWFSIYRAFLRRNSWIAYWYFNGKSSGVSFGLLRNIFLPSQSSIGVTPGLLWDVFLIIYGMTSSRSYKFSYFSLIPNTYNSGPIPKLHNKFSTVKYFLFNLKYAFPNEPIVLILLNGHNSYKDKKLQVCCYF